MARWILLFFIVSLSSATAPCLATEIADIAELSPGDTGVCITEVEGGELLEFPIRVIGVLGAAGPDGERVLIRLEHPRFEHAGVAAGMSGSPVYVDGRLVGALAFAWGFAKDPIAGVTPFQKMMTIGHGDEQSATDDPGPRPTLSEILDARSQARLPDLVVDWLLPNAVHNAPAPIAVGLGGLLAGGGQPGWADQAWSRLGWVSTPISGGRAELDDAPQLRPGSMIAGVLVEGDANLAVGGTVTEVSGDQIWAFGHPFLGAGDISIPLAHADVVTIMPSLFNSFKVFNVGEMAGSLLADRVHGVWGKIGASPKMIPLTVSADGADYSFRILDHRVMTPLFAGFLAFASQNVRGNVFGPQIVDLGMDITFGDDEKLELVQSFEGSDAPAQASAWVSAVLAYLRASRFEAPPMRSIGVDLELNAKRQSATILDVIPDRWTVAPGETLGMRVRWRGEHGRVASRRLEIVVPGELAKGRVDLVVADGPSWAFYDLLARPHRAASFADELHMLRRLKSPQVLIAALEDSGSSVVLPGGTVAAPEGFIASLRSALGPGIETTGFRVLAKSEVDAGLPISGAARISLAVKQRQSTSWED